MTLQYIKKCGDFFIACAAQGAKGEVGIESAKDRTTLYQYSFYGTVKIAEPFSNSSKIIGGDGKKGELVDVKEEIQMLKQDLKLVIKMIEMIKKLLSITRFPK